MLYSRFSLGVYFIHSISGGTNFILNFRGQKQLSPFLFLIFIFSSFRSYIRQKTTKSKEGKEQISVLEHLLSIIQSPPNQDTTYLSCSWAALVVLPHIRWENQLCLIVKSILANWWKYLIVIFLLFHEKVVECQFERFRFSLHFLDRPLEKEKVIPLVTYFIESLFMTVDRGSFGKGQLQSPFVLLSVFPGAPRGTVNTWVPENSTVVVFWQNPPEYK